MAPAAAIAAAMAAAAQNASWKPPISAAWVACASPIEVSGPSTDQYGEHRTVPHRSMALVLSWGQMSPSSATLDVAGLPDDRVGPVADPLVPAGTLDLATVLQAFSDPIRLRIVRKLADGAEYSCGSFELPVAKSTCSHHFRVLREAGVVEQRVDGKCRLNRLRRVQLEQRFPGLLGAVLTASRS